jgi:hypothetical protein
VDFCRDPDLVQYEIFTRRNVFSNIRPKQKWFIKVFLRVNVTEKLNKYDGSDKIQKVRVQLNLDMLRQES